MLATNQPTLDTQQTQDVHMTSTRRLGRPLDVQWTSCVCWEITADPSSNSHSSLDIQSNLSIATTNNTLMMVL